MAHQPPQEQPSGDEITRGFIPPWKIPEIKEAGLEPFVSLGDSVQMGSRRLGVNKYHSTRMMGHSYLVLSGIDSQEIDIDIKTSGLNLMFDETCTQAGLISTRGRMIFAGHMSAKDIKTRHLRFADGLDVFSSLYAINVKGAGDFQGKSLRAFKNIDIKGNINCDFVMALGGELSGRSIIGKDINGCLAVRALSGDLGYPESMAADERQACVIWSRDGPVYANASIRTGQVFAGTGLGATKGTIQLEGNAFCLEATFGRPVSPDVAARIYSRKPWEYFDHTSHRVEMPGKPFSDKEYSSAFDVLFWEKKFEMRHNL